MKSTWTSIIFEAYKKINKPLAYFLLFGAFALNYTSIPNASEGALLALGLLLLPIVFDIHKVVLDNAINNQYDNFDCSKAVLNREIEQITSTSGIHNIRYFALVAYNWPYFENCLNNLINKTNVPKINLELYILDPTWDKIDTLNPAWKTQVNATIQWVNNFFAIKKDIVEKYNWKFSITYYRFLPFYWGIAIDDKSLLFGTTYWENGRMRGGSNPIELYKSSNSKFDISRIQEFNGWLDVLNNKDNKLDDFVQPTAHRTRKMRGSGEQRVKAIS